MKKILLPIEETERSLKSIQYVKKHYRPANAEVVLMMVDERLGYSAKSEAEAAAIRELDDKLELISTALDGFKITKLSAVGKAGIRITRAAREVGADVIFMTKSSKQDMLNSIGTTTEYVINNASCDVLIVSEQAARNEYRGLVYRTAKGLVTLRGQLGDKQSECLLPSVDQDCIYHINVTVGKVRFFHTAYNPDTRNWDIPPLPGQEITLDIAAGETRNILVKADSTEGKADRIRIVNRDMKREAVFTFMITAAPGSTKAEPEAESEKAAAAEAESAAAEESPEVSAKHAASEPKDEPAPAEPAEETAPAPDEGVQEAAEEAAAAAQTDPADEEPEAAPKHAAPEAAEEEPVTEPAAAETAAPDAEPAAAAPAADETEAEAQPVQAEPAAAEIAPAESAAAPAAAEIGPAEPATAQAAVEIAPAAPAAEPAAQAVVEIAPAAPAAEPAAAPAIVEVAPAAPAAAAPEAEPVVQILVPFEPKPIPEPEAAPAAVETAPAAPAAEPALVDISAAAPAAVDISAAAPATAAPTVVEIVPAEAVPTAAGIAAASPAAAPTAPVTVTLEIPSESPAPAPKEEEDDRGYFTYLDAGIEEAVIETVQEPQKKAEPDSGALFTVEIHE